MEGVQFLLSEPIYEYGMGFGLCLFFSFVLTCLLWGGIWSGGTAIVIKKYWLFIPAICCIATYIIGFTHLREAVAPKFSHNEYQVVVHDGVDFNEFMELYTIKNVEGEIYTITINAETAIEEPELAIPQNGG